MSRKKNNKNQQSKEKSERKIDDPQLEDAVYEGNVRYTALFCGGDSFKFQMLEEDMHSPAGLNYAQEKAFEEFEMKVGKSVRKDYIWVIGVPLLNSNGEIVQTFTSEKFFIEQQIQISNIVQRSLIEVDELKEEKKKWDHGKQIEPKKKREEWKKTSVLHTDGKKTSKPPTSCDDCKELKTVIAELQQSNTELKTVIAELQQSNTEQQQINAYLLSTVNSVVLPMQKIHLRVLIHNMRVKVCKLLGDDPNIIKDWFAYLGGILASPEQLRTLQMGADIIRFVQIQAEASKLNRAAHEAEQDEIAVAVLAVKDPAKQCKWERIFFSVYGVAPTIPTIEEEEEIWV